jgi:hypothetical protein
VIDLDDLAAREQLWHEHHQKPIQTAADEAESLRIVHNAYAVLFRLQADHREAACHTEYASALDAAAQGKLTPQHIAAVARLAKAAPEASTWVRTLRCFLERQSGGKGPRRAGKVFDWNKDPRAWTQPEIAAWERAYPGWHFSAWLAISVNEKGEWIR